MRGIVKVYVGTIAGIAPVWSVAVYRAAPVVSHSMLYDALLLCGLAVTAELLAYFPAPICHGIAWFHPLFRGGDCCPGLAECLKRRRREGYGGDLCAKAVDQARSKRVVARVNGATAIFLYLRLVVRFLRSTIFRILPTQLASQPAQLLLGLSLPAS